MHLHLINKYNLKFYLSTVINKLEFYLVGKTAKTKKKQFKKKQNRFGLGIKSTFLYILATLNLQNQL